MARDHARIQVAVWRDPEFVALPKDAQRLYMLLLSQPKLSLCGGLDFTPGRWEQLASDEDGHELGVAVEALEAGGFIVVDEDAAELIIRSFVRHDGVLNSPNLVQAMWKSWEGLHSDFLRRVLVHEWPDVVFEPGFGSEKKTYEPPAEAVEMRSLEPLPKGSAKGSPTPVPSPSPSPATGTVVVSTADDDRFAALVKALARYDLARRREDKPEDHVGDEARWLDTAERRRMNLNGTELRAVVEARPDLDIEDLLTEFLAAGQVTAKPSAYDGTAAARDELLERNYLRRIGQACEVCHGNGTYWPDESPIALDCECKRKVPA